MMCPVPFADFFNKTAPFHLSQAGAAMMLNIKIVRMRKYYCKDMYICFLLKLQEARPLEQCIKGLRKHSLVFPTVCSGLHLVQHHA